MILKHTLIIIAKTNKTSFKSVSLNHLQIHLYQQEN